MGVPALSRRFRRGKVLKLLAFSGPHTRAAPIRLRRWLRHSRLLYAVSGDDIIRAVQHDTAIASCFTQSNDNYNIAVAAAQHSLL